MTLNIFSLCLSILLFYNIFAKNGYLWYDDSIIQLHEAVSKLVHTILINKVYHANLIVNYYCFCGYFNENAEHYLLHCNRFTLSRIIMLFEINKLNLIGIPVNIDLLLFGNETLNCIIFLLKTVIYDMTTR
jgi:hypothetical protein